MELDLDALELRALRFHKLNPLHECFDSTTALGLIARVRELEAIVNDGGNQAAKYWTRLTEAEREMHARELHHFEEEQKSAELAAVIERVRAWADDPYNRQTGRIAGLDNILGTAPADALRAVKAEAIRDMARRVRAQWAPNICGWVGALDDEADRIEKGEQ